MKTGRLIWTWSVPDPGEARSARGPANSVSGQLHRGNDWDWVVAMPLAALN